MQFVLYELPDPENEARTTTTSSRSVRLLSGSLWKWVIGAIAVLGLAAIAGIWTLAHSVRQIPAKEVAAESGREKALGTTPSPVQNRADPRTADLPSKKSDPAVERRAQASLAYWTKMKSIVERQWPDFQQAGTQAILGNWSLYQGFNRETLKLLTDVPTDQVDEDLLFAWKKRAAMCLATTILIGQADEAIRGGDTRKYAALVDQIMKVQAGPDPITFELESVRRLMVRRYGVSFTPLAPDLSADQLDEDRSVPIPMRTTWLGRVRMRELVAESRVGFQCVSTAAAYFLTGPVPNFLVALPGVAADRLAPVTRWSARIEFQLEAAPRDGILCTFRNHHDEVIWRTVCSQKTLAARECLITADCRSPEPVASISFEPAKLGELTKFEGDQKVPQPGILLPPPPSPIRQVAVSTDDRWLASADDDGLVVVREVWTGKTRLRVRMKEPVESLMLSDDGRYLGVGCGRDGMDGQGRPQSPLTGPPNPLGRRENVGEQGRPLRASGAVRIWDLDINALVFESTSYSSPVRLLSFARNGSHCLTAGSTKSAENNAQLWSTRDGKLVASFAGHRTPIASGAVSPDAKKVLTADQRGSILLWEVGTEKPLHRLAAGPDNQTVLKTAFSIDAMKIAAAVRSGEKCREFAWSVVTGQRLVDDSRPLFQAISVVPVRSGIPNMVGPLTPSLTVYDPRTGDEIDVDPPISANPTCSAIFGEGRFLVVGLENGTTVIWLLQSANSSRR